MKPYYDDGTVQIHHGDSRELLPGLRADVIVTDPPYGLEFMGKEWDKFRASGIGGKAYQAWTEEWADAAWDALPPGGWLLAFGGTRTWHRLACGIGDAGFVIRDTLMWLYGSGFPKGKACLKPGWEPILLARKPGSNVLQIDACRVGTADDLNGGAYSGGLRDRAAQHSLGGGRLRRGIGEYEQPSGRWPANVVMDEVAADLLDQQSAGQRAGRPAGSHQRRNTAEAHNRTASMGRSSGDWQSLGHADEQGGASRFFYTAKAGRSERVKVDGEQHPTVKPLALMRWLVRLVTPPGGTVLDPFCGSGSTLVAARMEGFRAIGIEADERWCRGSAQRLSEIPPIQEALL